MKARPRALDGFAIQNTRNVLCAIAAYEQSIRAGGTRGEAEASAASVYESVSGKTATARTVRRWLIAVKSYGGVEKVPESAFGVRKACPHVARPIRDLLRQIKVVVAGLSRESAKDPRAVTELTVACQLLGEVLSAAHHNPAVRHLVQIKALASRLANTPVHQLHRFTSAQDMEEALRDILVRLRGIPATGAKGSA